ncbi:hypothetical protein ACTXGQ_02490 [Marinobacter sp. 1Y8]
MNPRTALNARRRQTPDLRMEALYLNQGTPDDRTRQARVIMLKQCWQHAKVTFVRLRRGLKRKAKSESADCSERIARQRPVCRG